MLKDIKIKKKISIAVVVNENGTWDCASVETAAGGDIGEAFEIAAGNLAEISDEVVVKKYLIEAEIDASHKIELIKIKGRTLIP
jgi:hypothetical protein